MELSPQQYKQLRDALASAFPTYDDLRPVAQFGLGQGLGRIVAPTGVDSAALRLIDWAEAHDLTDKVILAAREENPTNVALRDVAEQLDLASPLPQADFDQIVLCASEFNNPKKWRTLMRNRGVQVGTRPAKPLERGDFERIVLDKLGFQNPTDWRTEMYKRELTVCRVEVSGGRGIGTGFLLGRTVAITNDHVKADWEAHGTAGDVVFRFGYWKKKNGVEVQKGREYRLTESDWLLDHSPEEELDYVLLRLSGQPGTDSIGKSSSSPSRGWLTPDAYSFRPSEPMFILQHPKARPLEVAIGTVLHEVPPTGVEYNVNTDEGSSGSPCFNAAWKLVALHHWGSKAGNRGVKFSAILNRLEKKGLKKLLGA